MRHFLNLVDLSTEELTHLLAEATRLKAESQAGRRQALLAFLNSL